ncbi:MAG: GNAT family N-acetyltransferase, partial [Ahrensia sp.]|nr:GNAT family N-acetyltransferase [Ahrensia sp.]
MSALQLHIRPVERSDYDQWHQMWTKYLEFTKSSVAPEVYISTFDRFFDEGEFEPNCLIAQSGDQMVGLVHFLYHRHNWFPQNDCYLQDLYADETRRGTGIGRKLIEAVYARADA